MSIAQTVSADAPYDGASMPDPSDVSDPARRDCSAVLDARNSGAAVESSGIEAKSFDVDADSLDAGDRRLRA